MSAFQEAWARLTEEQREHVNKTAKRNRMTPGEVFRDWPEMFAPARALPPEIEEQVKANLADQQFRKRVRAELRGMYGAWGMSKDELADLLGDEAIILRAEVEAAKRLARGGR